MDVDQVTFMDSSALVGVGIAAVTVMAAAGAARYLSSKPNQRICDLTHLINQSVLLEDGSREFAQCSSDDFPLYYYPDVQTTFEIFKRGIKLSNNGDCLASRSGPNGEFQWLSYQTVYDMALHVGSGLFNLGIEPGQSTFIGIYSQNNIEWDVVDLTCSMFSMVSVPLFDTLSLQGCIYVVSHTEIETIFCDTENKITNLLIEYQKMPTLKRIVSLVKVKSETLTQAKSHGIEILTFSKLVESGKVKCHDIKPCQPDDLFSICYTSGTTGIPKGVIVSQKNLMAQLTSVINHTSLLNDVSTEDRHLSYLPLAHMLERIIHQYVFVHGAKLGFFRGDITLLIDDLKAMKPTFFFTVPRLVNKIYDKVTYGVKSSRLKQYLFNMALRAKTKELQQGIIRNNSIWDKLIFKKVAQALGGCVKFMVVTSAPLSVEVLNFLRCAFGCVVTEVYGSSEMCGGVAATLIGECNTGHVGPPTGGYKIKLVDVPELGHYAINNQGEICIKGVGVSSGYYKNPEKTAELIDNEGWAHIGDIGEWTNNGTLKIIGRKKDIFKLSQGEYIAVEKIENVYLRCEAILQIFVTGDSLQNYPVAVVVPDLEVFLSWVNVKGIKGTMNELCQDENVKQYFLKSMRDEATRLKLLSFEQVKKIHIHPDLFTIDDGFLTPTLKNKRPVLQSFFNQIVSDLYKS